MSNEKTACKNQHAVFDLIGSAAHCLVNISKAACADRSSTDDAPTTEIHFTYRDGSIAINTFNVCDVHVAG